MLHKRKMNYAAHKINIVIKKFQNSTHYILYLQKIRNKIGKFSLLICRISTILLIDIYDNLYKIKVFKLSWFVLRLFGILIN